MTKSQAKKKCQWRAIASHCGPGIVAQLGKRARGRLGRRRSRGRARRWWRTRCRRCGSCRPARPACSRARDREPRRRDRRVVAPVERRMGVEDVEAAAEQDRQADDVDPVHQAHRQAMPVDASRRDGRAAASSGGALAVVSMREPSPGCRASVERYTRRRRAGFDAGRSRSSARGTRSYSARARRAQGTAVARSSGRSRTRASPVDARDHAVGGVARRRLRLEHGDREVGERLLERDVVAAGGDVEQHRLRLHPEARRRRLPAPRRPARARSRGRSRRAPRPASVELHHLDAEQAQPPHRVGLARREPVAAGARPGLQHAQLERRLPGDGDAADRAGLRVEHRQGVLARRQARLDHDLALAGQRRRRRGRRTGAA